jgi:phage terminase large subunit-like protein
VKNRALSHPGARVALVAETFADGRDTMVEGESGLLEILPPWTLRGGNRDTAWNRSMGELYLANGSRFKIFSSEKAGQLRGPQHHYAWADEVAKWRDAHKGEVEGTTWTNLMLGLRLGAHPQCVVTSTPAPIRLLLGDRRRPRLDKRASTHVTRGSSRDNLENLAPTFRQEVLGLYEGTRLAAQEIEGLLLEDTPGALWSLKQIDELRVDAAPRDMLRIVVAVDPQGSSDDDGGHAETGIIVAGVDRLERHGYILEDCTVTGTPAEWAAEAVAAYRRWNADRIVAERNNGGEMVEHTIRTCDQNVPVKTVWASRGKRTRAEPISALYEQRKVHHVGMFADLEHQQTTWMPESGEDSPDRMDAAVWALTELMLNGGDAKQTPYRPTAGREPVVKRGELTLVGEKYVDKE